MKKSSSNKNILFILTDQFRFDCLSCLGHPTVKTPNLDRLAKSGVLFKNAYCATMPCGPARTSIFTGLYPDVHKSVDNHTDMVPPDLEVIPQFLRSVGYDTALVGKLHLKPFKRDYGFNHFLRNDAPYTNYFEAEAYESAYIQHLKDNEVCQDADAVELFTTDEASLVSDELRFMMGSNITDEAHHMTTWTANESIKYIESNPERPWFLNASFFGPHQPYLCPDRWGKMYDPETLPLPEDFYNETNDKPIYANGLAQWQIRRDENNWDEAVYRKILAGYYGNISMIDHYIGKILDSLQETGQWDDTIIIFAADHGDYAGQFKLFYKGAGYEGANHVPMIIRHPDFADGRVEDCIVNTIDLFATIIKQGGCQVPDYAESKDLTPLLAGNHESWDNKTFFKWHQNAAIIKDNFKLMTDIIDGKTVYEFYDLSQRPLEAVNHYDNPNYTDTIQLMQQELRSWIEKYKCS